MLGMPEVCIASHVVGLFHALCAPNTWISILVNEIWHVIVYDVLHILMVSVWTTFSRQDKFYATMYATKYFSYHIVCDIDVFPCL